MTDVPTVDASGPGSIHRLHRFSRAERIAHRSLAVLMITCIVAAAILYNASLAVPIGHRRLVKTVHVWSGYAIPLPLALGLLSAAYRTDVRRLNRFSSADWAWLRSRRRRNGEIRVDKFNAGQKLNAALSTGAVVVMVTTGTVMFFPEAFRLGWRMGATFVHDWVALALGLLVVGHIAHAVRDPESRRGMRTGEVSAAWAREHHGAWADEEQTQPVAQPTTTQPKSPI